MDSTHRRLVTELFFAAAPAALLREVATILASVDIPVMPLKGVLLQRLVYQNRFRPMADVDVLVPPAAFVRARQELCRAGFGVSQPGRDVFRRTGALLEIDLHRRLSATTRSRLRAEDMFQRGRPDTVLFGAPVVLPSPPDLFAHLLLHLTLHWINRGDLHHPEDIEAAAEGLSLSVPLLVPHLHAVGLRPHALLMLPLLEAHRPGGFAGKLYAALAPTTRAAAGRVVLARRLCHAMPGSLRRRAAGFLLAPSLTEALGDAVRVRILDRQQSFD